VLEDTHAIPGAPLVSFELSTFAGLTDEDGDGDADDLAAGASATAENDLLTFTYHSTGTATNTATVSGRDETSGETVTDTDTVTVTILNQPPVFHDCPADIVVDNDPGLPSAVVSWMPPTATDASGVPPTVVSTHNPGDTFPVGLTAVTYTAADADGGTATCLFNVIVRNTEPPIVQITVPGEDDIYFVGQEVLAQWTATSIIDLESVQSTIASGEPLDTSRGGSFRFRVTATDVTGLSTTVEVPWSLLYLLRPTADTGEWSEEWLCIDHCLPVEERVMIGSVPLGGIYAAGEPIQIFFALCGTDGKEVRDCIASLSVTRVNDPESNVRFDDLLDYLVRFHLFRFDPEQGGYFFELQTWGYPVGYYDLWITVDAVLQQRIRIQIVEAPPPGG